ncbi:hypothetical protein CS542_07620 [Pedobacter sp. IW39]|nr:hypothetical protein CS542_07620 [Pedobacter sp. IW39]
MHFKEIELLTCFLLLNYFANYSCGMKRLLIIFIAVFYCTSILAQQSNSSDPKKTVYGIVKEQQSEIPVVYATVSVKDESRN